MNDAPHPLDFFAKLRWLDGRPLLETIEPYRRAIFGTVLYTFDGNRPQYNLAVCGRAKKNWKTADRPRLRDGHRHCRRQLSRPALRWSFLRRQSLGRHRCHG